MENPGEGVHERVVMRLVRTGVLTRDAALRIVPRKYERLGQVVVVASWPDEAAANDSSDDSSSTNASTSTTSDVCSQLASAMLSELDARCVLLDAHGIGGELREPSLRCVALRCATSGDVVSRVASHTLPAPGDASSPTLVDEHVEGGIRYRFDARQCMFASGNGTERMHARQVDASGETVVDMFAGLGYFTLPFAKSAQRVIAIEKNSNAFRWLCENLTLNGVVDRVTPLCGDNRLVGDEFLGCAVCVCCCSCVYVSLNYFFFCRSVM